MGKKFGLYPELHFQRWPVANAHLRDQRPGRYHLLRHHHRSREREQPGVDLYSTFHTHGVHRRARRKTPRQASLSRFPNPEPISRVALKRPSAQLRGSIRPQRNFSSFVECGTRPASATVDNSAVPLLAGSMGDDLVANIRGSGTGGNAALYHAG
jgi:hypothetical protein